MLFPSCFKMHDTYGLPLSIQIPYLEKRGLRADLYKFSLDAARAGWKTKKIKSSISEAMIDSGRVLKCSIRWRAGKS